MSNITENAVTVTTATVRLCQTCRHWSPLFTGETWGVRSFADAPADVRADITARLAAQFEADGYVDLPEEIQFHGGVTAEANSGASEVPGGADWPYWGECERTRLLGRDNGAGDSLAMAIDGSMFRAVLRCRANFGCVQWTAFDYYQANEAGPEANP